MKDSEKCEEILTHNKLYSSQFLFTWKEDYAFRSYPD